MAETLTIGALDIDERLVARLASAHTVIAWSRRQPRVAPSSSSIRIADSMASACAAPIVLSTFDDDAALVNGTCGAGGVLRSLPAGAIHITCGLHARAAVETVSGEHERSGHRFVAAPILLAAGVGQEAAAVLGGPADAIARIEPLFDAVGISIAGRCDHPADAALLAAAHSAMLACATAAIAEAFALVRKYGVDSTVMRDVISDALFHRSVYVGIADAMLGSMDDSSPSTRRGLHILDIALDAANRAHVPLPSVDACRDRLLGAIARGDGERSWTVIAREQARASGLE